MNPLLLGPEETLRDVFGIQLLGGTSLGEDLPPCPVGAWITSACKCPVGTTLVHSGGQAACVDDASLKDGSGSSIDWDKVVQTAAAAGINITVSALCKATGIGCPAPPPAGGYPAGYYYDPPWYKTTVGAVAITLFSVGGAVGLYLLLRK